MPECFGCHDEFEEREDVKMEAENEDGEKGPLCLGCGRLMMLMISGHISIEDSPYNQRSVIQDEGSESECG